MRSFVSTLGNDLGVWCFKRHRCWTRISVHLYHRQFITGIHHWVCKKENCGGDNFTSLMIYFPTVHKHLSSCLSLSIQMIIFSSLRKPLTFRDIRPCFPAKGALRSHTDDVSLPTSGSCLSLVETNFPFNTTNQKHYQDLGSDKSQAWEFGSPQTLFRGETSGGVPKRWPRLRFQSC